MNTLCVGHLVDTGASATCHTLLYMDYMIFYSWYYRGVYSAWDMYLMWSVKLHMATDGNNLIIQLSYATEMVVGVLNTSW